MNTTGITWHAVTLEPDAFAATHNRPSLTQDVYMGRGLASPEAATALQRSR